MDRRSVIVAGTAALTVCNTAGAQSAVATELTRFTSRNKPIRAVAMRPAELNGAGLVFIHGSGSIGPLQLRFAERFAQAGYLTLVPTYLDAAADDGIRRAPIMEAWRDCAIDAVDWLITQGVPAGRTAIAGYSLGSYIAVDSALGGGRARAAIGVAGGWDVYPPRRPRRRLPVLLVRAGSDDHVSPQGTARWTRFLRDAEAPVREAVIVGAEHLMTETEWAEVYRRSADFLTDALDPA